MPQYELNLRDYLRIMRKRRIMIVTVFILIFLGSLLHTSLQLPIYEASATVKIEERKTIAGLLTEWIIYNPADIMESQTKIIRGYPVMRRVALRLGMIDQRSSLEDVNAAVSQLQASVETERIANTNMIRITATSNDPKKATDLANNIAEAYIEENLLEKTKQARHARQFIEEQLTTLETRLKDTEESLRRFGEEVKNVKLAGPIEQKLMELEFELAGLLQKYTEKHPRVIQLKDQIKEMEMQLKGFSGQELEYARLSREVEVNKKLYTMLKEKLEEARITEAQKVGDVSLVDPAVIPRSPVSPNRVMGVFIGLMLGLILGVASAFVAETLDTSIATIEDVENIVKLPVLGIIPSVSYKPKQTFFARFKNMVLSKDKKTESEERFIHLVAHYNPTSLAAEAFRNVRTNLKLDASKKAILVTSANPREGKTTVLTNLGIVTAQAGAKVLLVSTDLRRPALAKIFGIKKDVGINELLVGSATLEQVLKNITDIMLGEIPLEDIVGRPPGIENVWLLPSGRLPYNPAEILELKKMSELIEELKMRFDVILFDSPPVLPVTDASLLAPKVDCVVIVYEIGKTSREALQRTKIQLESVGARISGVVLNNTRPQTEAISTYPYYYHYKYRYYGKEEKGKGSRA
ncbi:MAG: polysaccharide biosynthesis tyrosine autokinase [Candidatus Omnitrophica bacterium]|nr:polysaccharide biosynthesis tyrosine autokinase [Candidatus Omnitrophota bacterium]